MKFKFENLIIWQKATVTCLHKAHRRNYISDKEFELHYEFAYNLMNMIVGFKQKIK
jgi:hypothetical protein